jgi:hypothetical protein
MPRAGQATFSGQSRRSIVDWPALRHSPKTFFRTSLKEDVVTQHHFSSERFDARKLLQVNKDLPTPVDAFQLPHSTPVRSLGI